MNNNEYQVEIVRDAMVLTEIIQIEKVEFRRISREQYKQKPKPPSRSFLNVPKAKVIIPEKPTVDFEFGPYLKKNRYFLWGIPLLGFILMVLGTSSSGSLLLALFGVTLVLIFPFIFLIWLRSEYNKEKEKMQKKAENDPAYIEAVQAALKEKEEKQKQLEEETRRKQQKLDEQYEREKEHYLTVVLPEYEKLKAEWEKNKAEKLDFIERNIAYNEDVLQNLYETTKIISISYRDIEILKWLYADMSSSDHDIRYATELLDRDRQRRVTENVGKQVQDTLVNLDFTIKQGFDDMYAAIEQGNCLTDMLLDEAVDISSNAKKIKVIAGVDLLVGTYQRHGTNVMLKEHFGNNI